MPDLVPLTRRCTRCGAIGAPPERVGDCRELIHCQVRGTATEEIAGLRTMLATVTAERDQAALKLGEDVAARAEAELISTTTVAEINNEAQAMGDRE